MAAGGDTQANLTSVQRDERVCTALQGMVSPEGLLYFQGRPPGPLSPPEEAGQGGKRVSKKRGGRCG